jgi:hypothetical protein
MITSLQEASPATRTAARLLDTAVFFGRAPDHEVQFFATRPCDHRVPRVRTSMRTVRSMAELELERRRALEAP